MKLSKKDRINIWNKFDKHCAYCGMTIELKEMQVDHIKPIGRGLSKEFRKLNKIDGTDSFDNYNPSCRQCNFRKGMLTLEEFREAIFKGIEVLSKNFTFRMIMKYQLIRFTYKEVEFYFEKFNKEKNNES